MPSGIFKITGLPLDNDLYESEVKIQDEKIVALLKEQLKPKKKKPNKKTAAASQKSENLVNSQA